MTPDKESAGSDISAQKQRSMYPFSFDLINGARFFADAAATEEDDNRRRYLNTGCIVFAAATIEAVLNENISVGNFFGQDVRFSHIPQEFLTALASTQKYISLKDKWNLFVSVRGGYFWDSSSEPFQSYETIIAVRNELLHYKADFLGPLEPPINKIKPLLTQLCKDSSLENSGT
jgi:hypothetical protein